MPYRLLSAWFIAWAIALPVSIAGTSILYFPLIGLYILLGAWTFRRWPSPWGNVENAFLVFWLLGLTSAILGVDPHHTHNIARLSKELYFATVVLLGAYLSREPEGPKLLKVFMITAIVTAGLGALQFLLGINRLDYANGVLQNVPSSLENVPQKLLKGLSMVNGRAIGTRAHPLTYAEGLLFPLGYIFSLLSMRHVSGWRWIIALYVVLLGLVASQSRGPWIAAVVMGIFLCVMHRDLHLYKRLALVTVPVLLCFAAPNLRKRVSSIGDADYKSNSERLEMWHAGYHMLRDHPLLGVGPGNVHVASPLYQSEQTRAEGPWGHLHNTYVTVAAEQGLLGLTAFLSFIGILGWELWKGYQLALEAGQEDAVIILQTALLSLAGWLVAGFTETVNHDSNVLMMFYFVMGIALATARGLRRDAARV